MTLQYRLVPMLQTEPPKASPVHVTEVSDFMLISYIENVQADFIDPETDEIIDSQNLNMVTVVTYWLEQPMRYHLLVVVDPITDVSTLHSEEDAIAYSQFIHQEFENYMVGEVSEFPKYRALGWLLVPATAAIDIKMAEERAYNMAKLDGDHDYDATVVWAELDGILLESEPPLEETPPPDIQLNKSITDFLDKLEGSDDKHE
jgi:hypothetical protein